MEKTKRRIIRHVLAVICLVLALLGGLIPIFQGWMFFAVAVILLAIDYRWIRNWALRPLYRRYPAKYSGASRWRRKMRIRCAHRFGQKGHSHPGSHPAARSAQSRPDGDKKILSKEK